uniref:Regulating synaptic membrane exocytosis 3 n=1 Tax=Accipiter nisus TaxID=211598 RepID=A0A8B9N3V1_9AVES
MLPSHWSLNIHGEGKAGTAREVWQSQSQPPPPANSPAPSADLGGPSRHRLLPGLHRGPQQQPGGVCWAGAGSGPRGRQPSRGGAEARPEQHVGMLQPRFGEDNAWEELCRLQFWTPAAGVDGAVPEHQAPLLPPSRAADPTQQNRVRRARERLTMFNGDASSSAARNVVRSSSISGEMYNIEKSARGSADSVTVTASKKRRSSLGAKMVAIVGLSQWSKSTLQLNQTEGGPKKLRSNIRRSTETGIAVEMRTRVTRQGSRESTDGSTNSNSSDGTFIFPTTRLGAESQFSDFLDGLGPGQLVGRQTLATPPMGDVHVGMADRNGQLEVEVIQARGLIPKMGSKSIPGRWLGGGSGLGTEGGAMEKGAVLGPSQDPAPNHRFSPVFHRSHLRESLPVGERRLPRQEEDQGGEENLRPVVPAASALRGEPPGQSPAGDVLPPHPQIPGDRVGLGEQGRGIETQRPPCCPSDPSLPTPTVAGPFWPGMPSLPSFPQNSQPASGAAPLTPPLPRR